MKKKPKVTCTCIDRFKLSKEDRIRFEAIEKAMDIESMKNILNLVQRN